MDNITAHAQWIEVKIVSENMTLQVKNASLDWGKFYEKGDKGKEISADKVNKITVESGKEESICSCGKSSTATGTEGRFDLYDGETKIGKFYWDCPWWSKKNTFTWTPEEDIQDDYYTTCQGGHADSGAIGEVTIICIRP